MASLSSIQNPYSNQAQNYKTGILQKIWSAFGGRTGEDAYRENMAMNSAEFDSQLALKQYDQEYNSPTAQVARMRAAGLNPDLNGGQDIDPGSAAEMQPDPSVPMLTEGDENILVGFGRSLLSCFSTALGMVQSFQGIQRTAFQNRLLAAQSAKDLVLDFVPAEGLDSDNERSWQQNALDAAKMFTHDNRFSRKQTRSFMGAINTYLAGIPTDVEARSKWLNREISRKGYYKETSSMWSGQDDVLRAMWQPLGKRIDRILDLSLQAKEKGAEADVEAESNRLDYEGAIDPLAKAGDENSQAINRQQNNDIEFLMKDTWKEILDNLHDVANRGGSGAELANTVLFLMTLRVMDMMPHLDRLLPFLKAR